MNNSIYLYIVNGNKCWHLILSTKNYIYYINIFENISQAFTLIQYPNHVTFLRSLPMRSGGRQPYYTLVKFISLTHRLKRTTQTTSEISSKFIIHVIQITKYWKHDGFFLHTCGKKTLRTLEVLGLPMSAVTCGETCVSPCIYQSSSKRSPPSHTLVYIMGFLRWVQ